MTFSAHLSPETVVLLTVGGLAGLVYAVWQCRRALRLRHFVEHDTPRRAYCDSPPSVSVIVDACSETEHLAQFLPLMLAQDYPDFEVIVVTNSAAEAAGGVLSALKEEHHRLRVTFIPDGTRTLSRKKLSLMMGIKAAEGDIVFTTCAYCRPQSNQMLALAMRNFTPDVDIVLGYAHYDYQSDKQRGRRMRIFDTVSTATQWILAAIAGNAYRGMTEFLAYRKQLFFDNRGFARSMELCWGEDDVFLSQIARGHNVRVEISADSQLTIHYDDYRRMHSLLKMRRDFTSRQVRRNSFVVQGLMSSLWAVWGIAVALAVVGQWSNATVWIAATVTGLLTWPVVSWAVAQQCRLLQAPRLRLTAPLMAWLRPWSNALHHLRQRRNKKSNYTSYN